MKDGATIQSSVGFFITEAINEKYEKTDKKTIEIKLTDQETADLEKLAKIFKTSLYEFVLQFSVAAIRELVGLSKGLDKIRKEG